MWKKLPHILLLKLDVACGDGLYLKDFICTQTVMKYWKIIFTSPVDKEIEYIQLARYQCLSTEIVIRLFVISTRTANDIFPVEYQQSFITNTSGRTVTVSTTAK